MHVYRWDLDRTYLDTDIRSVRGMLRAAWEPPDRKRNIPGADALLRGLIAAGRDVRTAILSGSPTQLRGALAQKLELDGIRYDTLVLKDNLGNLKRGRLRALKGQLGYKLPRLLAHRLAEAPDTTESLFGDDAEVDALVYTLYADAVEGRVEPAEVADVMRLGGAYDDQVDDALRSLRHLTPRAGAVSDVWIHVDRGVPLTHFGLLGTRVRVVFSWLQAALGLHAAGRLGDDHVVDVVRAVGAAGRHDPTELAALCQDAVRRGVVPAAHLRDLLARRDDLSALVPGASRALEQLGSWTAASTAPPRHDYTGFLRVCEKFA